MSTCKDTLKIGQNLSLKWLSATHLHGCSTILSSNARRITLSNLCQDVKSKTSYTKAVEWESHTRLIWRPTSVRPRPRKSFVRTESVINIWKVPRSEHRASCLVLPPIWDLAALLRSRLSDHPQKLNTIAHKSPFVWKKEHLLTFNGLD